MPKEQVYTEINGQKVKLTNLSKILFPENAISKAEVVQYYLSVAERMIPIIGQRPLSLIRFPDGITEKQFYTKNKPSFTPDWIPSSKVPWDEEKTYLLANQSQDLIWLANLAALEIHIINSRISNIQQADHFVIDLDPSIKQDFLIVKKTAFALKGFLLAKGYQPFVKLSGGKGVHIICPIHPENSYDEMIAQVKNLMLAFIKDQPDCTLKVHKENRVGKILLDIYRNHPGNTTVAAYSLRGKAGAPVSMPISWEQLHKIESAQHFTIKNALDHIKGSVDPWAQLHNFATPLIPSISSETIASLESYSEKRDFNKTTEPIADVDAKVNDCFVIQLHDASNLHYDLRLGIRGVLKSWAIPKGLPIERGVKRLAIQTEDHPAKYIDFEGSIPKEEYGGGQMWIFDQGKIEWLSKKENKSYKFKLVGEKMQAEFSLFHLRDNQWLIERKSTDSIADPSCAPMLSESRRDIPSPEKYLFEVKWDGIRALIHKSGDQLVIKTRNGRDISNRFPEFAAGKFIDVEEAIIDAEIVCLDEVGRPIFADIISRMHSSGEMKISQMATAKKAYLYCFDCLFLDGQDISNLPIERRKEWLNAIIKKRDRVRISESFDNGKELYDAAKKMNLEGIMAKERGGKYYPGSRSTVWQKIKFRSTTDALIIGFTEGNGERSPYFGALHLAKKTDDGFQYLGKVGSGFDQQKLKAIKEKLALLKPIEKPIDESVDEPKRTVWVEARLFCEIEYAALTNTGILREPVFLRLRPDLET